MIKVIIIVRNNAKIVDLMCNPLLDDVILIRPHATRSPAFLFQQQIKSIQIFKNKHRIHTQLYYYHHYLDLHHHTFDVQQ